MRMQRIRAWTFVAGMCMMCCWAEANTIGDPADASVDAQRVRIEENGGSSQLLLDGETIVRTTDATILKPKLISVPDDATLLLTWSETGANGPEQYYAISLDGRNIATVRKTTYEVRLRHGDFDPAVQVGAVAPSLVAPAGNELYIVQFVTQPLEVFRQQIRDLGGVVRHYMPHHSHIVQMTPEVKTQVEALPYVRWVGPYHTAYRLEASLRDSLLGVGAPLPTQRYHIQAMEKGPAQKNVIADRILSLGGSVYNVEGNGFLFDATLTADQLRTVVEMNEVLFVDRWTPPRTTMNNVRIVGGADYVESVAGYTGAGVRAEIMDNGCQAGQSAVMHPDFSGRLAIRGNGGFLDESHGTATYGIVFGSGAGSATARGMLPDAFGYFNDWVLQTSRYTDIGELVTAPYNCVFQSNSWGFQNQVEYTSVTSDMDDAVFDHDIVILHSQGNSGTQSSVEHAWGKNIIGVGGVLHYNNSNTADDSWSGTGSIGPAADGRIKPDLCYYYDSIRTTRPTSTYTNSFGGTSAACPETAGHFGLFFQMWADGIFGNDVSGGTVFAERPHSSTARAVMINTAAQYPFSGTGADMTRTHQGWGRADAQNLYDMRNNMLIIDETDILQQFESTTYAVQILSGQPFHDALRATLTYNDIAGTTSSSQHRINDMTLKVTSPTGTIYYGNNGLLAGNWSTSGGSPNTIDTVENVFIQNPTAGIWNVEVIAADINQDGHVETPQVDMDYALVISGGNPFQDCNQNTINDQCDVDCGLPDCNVPGCGQSLDCNSNGFPDECEAPDCNGNSIPDGCELVGNDCNSDQVPDDCQLVGNDCDANLLPDDCDIAALEALIAGPADVTPCPGATAVLSVLTPGGLAYQWYGNGSLLVDGGDVSGATTDTLTIQNVDVADEVNYYCAVSDGCIVGNSQTASLTLVPTSIAITQEPVSQIVVCTASGQGAVYQMSVDNSLAVSYQWYLDGVAVVNDTHISGAQTNQLEISPVQISDMGFYACHAENPCGGSVDTDPARGELVLADPIYSQQPQDTCVSVSGSTTFSVTVSPSNTLLYWYQDGAQIFNGTDANGMVISGATTDTLQLSNVPASYDQSQFYVSGFNPNPLCQGDSSAATLTVGGCLPCCAASDVDCSGTTDAGDILVIRGGANWNLTPPANVRADVDGSGTADAGDILVVRGGAVWNVSTGPCDCACSP